MEYVNEMQEYLEGRTPRFPLCSEDLEALQNRFGLMQDIDTEERRLHADTLRYQASNLAEYIMEMCPKGPERENALTKLEEVVLWGHAAIARTS